MLKQSIRRWCGLWAVLTVPVFAISQAPVSSTPENANREFATIQTALFQAADAALKSSAPAASDPVQALPRKDTLVEQPGPRQARLTPLQARLEPILTREGVPNALAAVIQVESAGNPLALSPKGARGLWQLMPDTARRYGLIVDTGKDERIDLEKSTTTAARYLRDLYAQFGSWPLALAAYNAGEKNLQRAIERGHSNDFATLSTRGYLPAETRNYVPAVLAAMGMSQFTAAAVSAPARPETPTYALNAP